MVLAVALAGCTKSGDADAGEAPTETTEDPVVAEEGATNPADAVEATPEFTWETHEYLFSGGATVGTGQSAAPTTSTHPAELVDVPGDASFVRVEFRWEGIAVPGSTLTLAIGTGTLATLDRVVDATTGERERVVLDFEGDAWDDAFIATIAAEEQGSIVGEGTVEVRSTWFRGGSPDADWSAFDA